MLDLLAKEVVFVDTGTVALYALIGQIVVFLGIALLVFIVWLIGTVFTRLPKKQKKQAVAEEVSIRQETVSVEELDEQTVAVITAAIAAYYQKQQIPCEFVIKKIRRSSKF